MLHDLQEPPEPLNGITWLKELFSTPHSPPNIQSRTPPRSIATAERNHLLEELHSQLSHGRDPEKAWEALEAAISYPDVLPHLPQIHQDAPYFQFGDDQRRPIRISHTELRRVYALIGKVRTKTRNGLIRLLTIIDLMAANSNIPTPSPLVNRVELDHKQAAKQPYLVDDLPDGGSFLSKTEWLQLITFMAYSQREPRAEEVQAIFSLYSQYLKLNHLPTSELNIRLLGIAARTRSWDLFSVMEWRMKDNIHTGPENDKIRSIQVMKEFNHKRPVNQIWRSFILYVQTSSTQSVGVWNTFLYAFWKLDDTTKFDMIYQYLVDQKPFRLDEDKEYIAPAANEITHFTAIKFYSSSGDFHMCRRALYHISQAKLSNEKMTEAFGLAFEGFKKFGSPERFRQRTGGFFVSLQSSVESPWTLQRLEHLFDIYIQLPSPDPSTKHANIIAPSRKVQRDIIEAFELFPENDSKRIIQIWDQCEAKFGARDEFGELVYPGWRASLSVEKKIEEHRNNVTHNI